MSTRSLSEWVDYIQTLHFREIELSLERVRDVYSRLYPSGVAFKVISVAGTNGKGSTAELLSSIYNSASYRVGKFTSPHLVNFSERFSINGVDASEQALLCAFKRIEKVRADIPITFFEFGALLAIELFSAAEVDVAVMEIGLGGRLDAVNILDADVALITSISVDHTAWLGDSIDSIAYEKVGIARPHTPCVVGIEQPPQSIIDYCDEIDAQLHIVNRNFHFSDEQLDASTEISMQRWSWSSAERVLDGLPLPYLQSGVQISNAALALQAISLLSDGLPVSDQAIREGIEAAHLLARCQLIAENPLVILDVAHNESSIERLCHFVKNRMSKSEGRIVVVCGMLKDKEIGKSLAGIEAIVDEWHFVSINNERGASATHLQSELCSLSDQLSQQRVICHADVEQAYDTVLQTLNPDDCLVVFGSFFIAGDILAHIKISPKNS